MTDKPLALDDWLAAVAVDGPIVPKDTLRGWFLVQDYDGETLAWFPTYAAAYRFRLDHINRNLNLE